MKSQEKRKKIIARLLADHFLSLNPRLEPPSGCACIAPDCVDLRCGIFWETLLDVYTTQDFRRMIESYQIARRRN